MRGGGRVDNRQLGEIFADSLFIDLLSCAFLVGQVSQFVAQISTQFSLAVHQGLKETEITAWIFTDREKRTFVMRKGRGTVANIKRESRRKNEKKNYIIAQSYRTFPRKLN